MHRRRGDRYHKILFEFCCIVVNSFGEPTAGGGGGREEEGPHVPANDIRRRIVCHVRANYTLLGNWDPGWHSPRH